MALPKQVMQLISPSHQAESNKLKKRRALPQLSPTSTQALAADTPRETFDASMAAMSEREIDRRLRPEMIPPSVTPPAASPVPPMVERIEPSPADVSGSTIPATVKTTAPRRIDTAPPVHEQHKGGFVSRVKDALKVGLNEAGEGGIARGLGGFVGGLINPQAAHDQKHEREMKKYERMRKRELEEDRFALDTEYKQAAIDNIEEDNRRARENDTYTREDRRIAAEDRKAGLERQVDAEDRQAIEDFAIAFPGEPLTEGVIKGTRYRNQIGKIPAQKKSGTEQRPRYSFIKQADGTYKRVDQDTLAVEDVPGVRASVPGSGSDKDAAKLRAKNRVAQEYTGQHINQMINDRAAGLYSTYAQEEGITWEIEQQAKLQPIQETDQSIEALQAAVEKAGLGAFAKGGDPATQRKALRERIDNVRARAMAEAKAIVERDLQGLESRYIDEELARGADYAPGGLLDGPSVKVTPPPLKPKQVSPTQSPSRYKRQVPYVNPRHARPD